MEGKDYRKMRREPRGGREVNGKAKQADNGQKFYTTGDRDAKEEKQVSLGMAGNDPIAQDMAQAGP